MFKYTRVTESVSAKTGGGGHSDGWCGQETTVKTVADGTVTSVGKRSGQRSTVAVAVAVGSGHRDKASDLRKRQLGLRLPQTWRSNTYDEEFHCCKCLCLLRVRCSQMMFQGERSCAFYMPKLDGQTLLGERERDTSANMVSLRESEKRKKIILITLLTTTKGERAVMDT